MRTGITVLLTGSRDWPEDRYEDVHAALEECVDTAVERDGMLQVVVGDARGVDKVVYRWVRKAMQDGKPVLEPEVHSANWYNECDTKQCATNHRREDKRDPSKSICPAQGIYRNLRMVNREPRVDMCIAFIHNDSNGTTQCKEAAQRAGIPTVVFTS